MATESSRFCKTPETDFRLKMRMYVHRFGRFETYFHNKVCLIYPLVIILFYGSRVLPTSYNFKI